MSFPKSIYIIDDHINSNRVIRLDLNKVNKCEGVGTGLCASYGKNENHTLLARHMSVCYEVTNNDRVRQIEYFLSAEEAIKNSKEKCKKEIETLSRMIETKKSSLDSAWEVIEEE